MDLISRRALLATVGTAGGAWTVRVARGSTVNGGTFTVALDSDPPMLNPMISQVTQTFVTSNQIYDTLFKYNEKFEPVPWLARSWTVSPDGKTFDFVLNTGIKWHDGMPFSTDDIVYTFS